MRRITYSSLRSSPSTLGAPREVLAIVGVPVQSAGGHLIQFLGRGIAQQIHEGRIGDENAAVARRLIDALHDAFEQAAKFRLAVAQGVFGGAAFDGDAGDLRHARHELVIAGRGNAGLPAVHREGADHLAVRCHDGRGPGGPESPRARAASRRYSHRASVSMSATVTRRLKYTAAEQEPKRMPIGRIVHRLHEFARQIRRHAETQGLFVAIQQIDRAAALGHGALDQFANGLQRRHSAAHWRRFFQIPAARPRRSHPRACVR